MKNKIILYICVLFILFFDTGCSWFSSPTPDSDKALRDAWELFEMTNYDMAYSKFESIISMDPNNEEAYNGRGWCYLLLNDLERAALDFNTAIDKGYLDLDPHAGLAAVYISNDEFLLAISKAQYVITNDPEYTFMYLSDINYLDMHLILAMAYFHTGDFGNTYAQILILDPDIIVNENNSATWILYSVQYDSYPEILMAIIDDLDAQYGL